MSNSGLDFLLSMIAKGNTPKAVEVSKELYYEILADGRNVEIKNDGTYFYGVPLNIVQDDYQPKNSGSNNS